MSDNVNILLLGIMFQQVIQTVLLWCIHETLRRKP